MDDMAKDGLDKGQCQVWEVDHGAQADEIWSVEESLLE
jgi:hypothetical protein